MKDIEKKDVPDVSGGNSHIGPCVPEPLGYPQWPFVDPDSFPDPDHPAPTDFPV